MIKKLILITFICLLVFSACPDWFSSPTAAQALPPINYNIVYVRSPRPGNNSNTFWSDAITPLFLDPGASLMLLHPNGSFEVRENMTASPRSTTLTVAGQTITLLQEGATAQVCAYSISPASSTVSATGGAGSINVTANTGCAWAARSNVNWITITSSRTGVGNGAINFSVTANPDPRGRKGTIRIAGKTFTVKQT